MEQPGPPSSSSLFNCYAACRAVFTAAAATFRFGGQRRLGDSLAIAREKHLLGVVSLELGKRAVDVEGGG